MLAYVVLALLGDPGAYSGSDAGGRAATVRTMVETGSWVPEVGYWAADRDPEGRQHPLVKNETIDAHLVQTPTLLTMWLARPLWQVGGPLAALAIPMLGGVVCALAALGLARRLGAASGWGAFWLVGLASPVSFYALDLWEHTIALGAFGLAVYFAAMPPTRLVHGLRLGLVAGLAVSVRTEMGVYVLGLGVAVLAVGSLRRLWLSRWPVAAVAVVVAGSVFVAVNLAQRAVLGVGVQASRAGNLAERAGGDIQARAGDALLTSTGLYPSTSLDAYVLAFAALLGTGLVGLALVHRRSSWLRLGGVLAAVVYAIRIVIGGTGFVPGTLAASPLWGAGAAGGLGRHRVGGSVGDRRRFVALAALFPLPAVWMLQWTGDLLPQWAGRYTLATGMLLTIVGAVMCETVGWRTPASVVLVALTVSVSALGLAWHVERTRAVASTIDTLNEVPSDAIVVSGIAHLAREGGSRYGDRRWLTARSPSDLQAAADLAASYSPSEIEVVRAAEATTSLPDPTLGGYTRERERTVDYLKGFSLRAITYRRVA